MDEQEFEHFYHGHERAVYNVLLRWTNSASEAEDLMQDTFLKMWDMRSKLRGDPRALLFTIALNGCKSAFRKKKWLSWVSLPESASGDISQEKLLIQSQKREELNRAIQSLSPKLKETLLLVRFSEMSYTEVAAMLRVSEGTIASRLNAAQKKLAQFLDPKEGLNG